MNENQLPPELSPKKTPTRWHYWFLGAFLLLAAMMYLFYVYPDRNIGPEQPIPFSHRLHAGTKAIDCRFCHSYVASGPRAGIPVMEKCFYCHEYIIPLHPEIELERRFYESGTGVPWVRVYNVPDHVQFHHQPHILWAGLDCTRCHGEVERMDRLKSVNFQMEFCIDCHREMNAQVDCWLACHH